MFYSMSFSEWVYKVETFLGMKLGPEKYVIFFNLWFNGFPPRVGAQRYKWMAGIEERVWAMK